jgi:hypothetical protein
MDVYRKNLSMVIRTDIGEAEKNLASVSFATGSNSETALTRFDDAHEFGEVASLTAPPSRAPPTWRKRPSRHAPC